MRWAGTFARPAAANACFEVVYAVADNSSKLNNGSHVTEAEPARRGFTPLVAASLKKCRCGYSMQQTQHFGLRHEPALQHDAHSTAGQVDESCAVAYR